MLDIKKKSVCLILSVLFAGLVSGQETGQEDAVATKATFVVHSS